MQGIPQVTAGGINSIVTNLMIDFQQREEQYAARRVYPFVFQERDTGTIYADDAENSMRDEDSTLGRNKGATVVDIRLGGKQFAVNPRAYKTLVTDSDKRNFQGPMALENFITRKLMRKFLVNREVKGERRLRTSSAIQSQAGAAAWNNASLDPIKDIQTVQDKINKAIGQIGTAIIIPPALWSARVATNAANTLGKQMRDQLGYQQNVNTTMVTPKAVATWLGISDCIVPYCVKAGGNESTTLQTGGLTGNQVGVFIWSDTTQAYVVTIDPNPSVGTYGYGMSPGPQDIVADGPYHDWDIGGGGDWYRVRCIFDEYEAVGAAACKLTGL